MHVQDMATIPLALGVAMYGLMDVARLTSEEVRPGLA